MFDKTLVMLFRRLLREYARALDNFEAIASNLPAEKSKAVASNDFVMRQIAWTLDCLWEKWRTPTAVVLTLSNKDLQKLGYTQEFSQAELNAIAGQVRQMLLDVGGLSSAIKAAVSIQTITTQEWEVPPDGYRFSSREDSDLLHLSIRDVRDRMTHTVCGMEMTSFYWHADKIRLNPSRTRCPKCFGDKCNQSTMTNEIVK